MIIRTGARPRLMACLAAVAIATAAAACSASAPAKGGRQPVATVQPSAWDKLVGQIRPDGTVTAQTALTAFATAIGPVQGVSPVSLPKGLTIPSGTIAVDWVFAHWSELTDAQRVAVRADLGAPPAGRPATAPASGPDAALVEPAVARSSKPADPNVPCLTHDSPNTAVYRAQFGGIVDQIASRLGPLRVRSHVFFAANTKDISIDPDDPAAMYTWSCVGAATADDWVTGCTIHVNPSANEKNAPASVRGRLIHEITHCFMDAKYGAQAVALFPPWYVEGFATWVQSVLGPGDASLTSFWHSYLNRQGKTLNTLSYQGVGLFAHMAETLDDPWKAVYRMGDAMKGAGKGATLAGLRAAGLTEAFLNSWGSGFAEGRYPGSSSWVSTGPNLDQYTPARVDKEGSLSNGETLPLDSKPTASDLLKMAVKADVVEVTPGDNASGRVSLGGGADATLDVAASQTYCTLSAADCKCPAGSARAGTTFTHMAPGDEYAGLTGGTVAASISIHGSSLDDFCASKPSCVVGTWTSTKIHGVNLVRGRSHITDGGAGVRVTIDAKGNTTVVYNGMGRMNWAVHTPSGSEAGYTVWDGTQHGTVKLPPGKATSGTWKAAAGEDSVTVNGNVTSPYTASGSAPLDTYLAKGLSPDLLSPFNPGTFTCTATTLSLSVRFRTATGTWQLTHTHG